MPAQKNPRKEDKEKKKMGGEKSSIGVAVQSGKHSQASPVKLATASKPRKAVTIKGYRVDLSASRRGVGSHFAPEGALAAGRQAEVDKWKTNNGDKGRLQLGAGVDHRRAKMDICMYNAKMRTAI